MLLGTVSGSLLENMLEGKRVGKSVTYACEETDGAEQDV